MRELETSDFVEQFNRARQSVRVLTILSPT